jgi:hypothetical protein
MREKRGGEQSVGWTGMHAGAIGVRTVGTLVGRIRSKRKHTLL